MTEPWWRIFNIVQFKWFGRGNFWMGFQIPFGNKEDKSDELGKLGEEFVGKDRAKADDR